MVPQASRTYFKDHLNFKSLHQEGNKTWLRFQAIFSSDSFKWRLGPRGGVSGRREGSMCGSISWGNSEHQKHLEERQPSLVQGNSCSHAESIDQIKGNQRSPSWNWAKKKWHSADVGTDLCPASLFLHMSPSSQTLFSKINETKIPGDFIDSYIK